MKVLRALAATACISLLPSFAAPPKKKPVHKTAAATATHTTKASATTSRNTRGKTTRTSRGRTKRVSAPAYPQHPEPERYQQIQQALADKGYYKGPVNGEWGPDSVDAMRRFQQDRKLDGDGHITALTLRDLGLGPKHDGSSAPLSGAVTAATPPPPPKEAIPPEDTAPKTDQPEPQ